MANLSFNLQFQSSELQSLNLPVEVRKPNLVLVTKTLASKIVDVQPGHISFPPHCLPGRNCIPKWTWTRKKAEQPF